LKDIRKMDNEKLTFLVKCVLTIPSETANAVRTKKSKMAQKSRLQRLRHAHAVCLREVEKLSTIMFKMAIAIEAIKIRENKLYF